MRFALRFSLMTRANATSASRWPGMQAVWLSVKNDSDGTLYYLPATTDANYYTPPEASRLATTR